MFVCWYVYFRWSMKTSTVSLNTPTLTIIPQKIVCATCIRDLLTSLFVDGLHEKSPGRVQHNNASFPIDDGRALADGRGVFYQPRSLQVDDQTRDQSAPEPARDVRHVVSSSYAVHHIVYNFQPVHNPGTMLGPGREGDIRHRGDTVGVRLAAHATDTELPFWDVQLFVVARRLSRDGFLIDKAQDRTLVRQHGWD